MIRPTAVALALAAAIHGQESSGRTPAAGTTVLFPFDEVSVPWRDNLKVTLNKPVKHPGNPVFAPGPPDSPDGIGAILYGTVIHDRGKLRMWYLAWPRPDARIPGDPERHRYHRPIAYAESEDGIRWTRPELGLADFRGNRRNNLVRVEPESEAYSRCADFISVLLDEADPDPSRRYKMAYIVQDQKRRNATTATAVSPDGLRWKLVNTDMITRGHFENTSLLRFNGLYYASGQNFDPHGGHRMDGSAAGRLMTVFFSPDFRHWSTGRAVGFLRRDYQTKPLAFGQETHMGAGLWNRGNVILGVYGRWYGDTIVGKPVRLAGLKMDLGFVVSNDAIHYREPVPDYRLLEHGGNDEWDSESLLQGNAFANVGDRTLIWYSHWNTSNPYPFPSLPAKVEIKPQAVGLATLRRDGFGYFDKQVPGREASLLSAPLRGDGVSRVWLNIDGAGPDSPLEIELTDDAERRIPGYGATARESGLRVPVRFANGAATPAGKTFRVRAAWPAAANAKLFAVYVDRAGSVPAVQASVTGGGFSLSGPGGRMGR